MKKDTAQFVGGNNKRGPESIRGQRTKTITRRNYMNDNSSQCEKLLGVFDYFYKHLQAKYPEMTKEMASERANSLACTAYIQASKPAYTAKKEWPVKSGGYNKPAYNAGASGGAPQREAATGGLSQKQLNYMSVLCNKDKKNGWDGPGLSSYVNRTFGVQGPANLDAGQAKQTIDAILAGPVPMNGAAPAAGPSFTDEDIPF